MTLTTPPDAAPFVLFDPPDAPARLYRDPLATLRADTPAQLAALPDWIGAQLAAGREVALFVAFEAAQALAGLPLERAPITPLAEALSFAGAQQLDAAELDAWLGAKRSSAAPGAPVAPDAPAGFIGWRRSVSRAAYRDALRRIDAALRDGACYQVDYTFALHARAFGDPRALYAALRRRQPTPYRCLARLGGRWVLSLSPELFFALEPGGEVTVRPMKGTASRHADPERDARAARALAADAKNRAENLMILDLMRNDLGRIARPGSVRCGARFAVEPHGRLWQMVSTVHARLADGCDWATLWRALFPCGSVIGAPKHKAMQFIGELEPAARGLYCGTIGWLAPAGAGGGPLRARGACSVAIRTLELDAEVRDGTRAARLGVGSGVVADSGADAEWRECLLKARFATELDPGFGLIETFAARWGVDGARIDAHFARLARSARALRFGADWPALRAALAEAHAALPGGRHRTRIELRQDGTFKLETAPLEPNADGPVDLLLASDLIEDAAVDADDPLLAHKTTHRARLDAAWRAAAAQGAFDALLFNTRGELCEGGRSNVFVRIDGRWWTPPLRCGVLPGITRAALLADPAFGARQRCLTRADLARAEDWRVTNAVRGVLPARLRPQADGGVSA